MNTVISDIFFDLDHTLWDFEKNSALAFGAIFEKHGIKINTEEFLVHYIPINAKYWELYRHERVSKETLRLNRLKDSFELMGYSIDDETILFLSDEYIEYLPKYNHLFDGALDLLDYLKPKYNLHIITNGFHNVQESKLANSNIKHYFKTITNSESAGVKKPNPMIYEYALTAANTKKETSIMIGDCIDADVMGALSYGLDAILFNEFKKEIPHDVKQVSHLLDLKKYL